ncbi:MAG: site-specific DNA-methyltransferase [Anaerolineae bacterium]|nr:site-specific DNA-methyltransferase [Anaerolineae bacterium]MDW8098379.1 site-specific DNA-methyltransferase [Anaerolineae bacterium]
MTAGPAFPTNVLYCADSRYMRELPDNSVQLVVTSPPYNVGKPYEGHNDNLPLDEYLAFLNQVWRECYRVLVPGGRLCINVANTDRKPYLPLNALITAELYRMSREEGIRWLMRGEIIWDKNASVGVSTAWGSFGRASDPILRDVHEYIMIFSKDELKLRGGGATGITGGQFVSWTRSIWRPEEGLDDLQRALRAVIAAFSSDRPRWSERGSSCEGEDERLVDLLVRTALERLVRPSELRRKIRDKIADARRRGKDDAWLAESLARAAWQHFTRPSGSVWEMTTESSVDHPAPFPVELPRRLILLFTKPGDIVLDPFMGSGSTAIAAVLTGRRYVGYEISPEYCELARHRLAALATCLEPDTAGLDYGFGEERI